MFVRGYWALLRGASTSPLENAPKLLMWARAILRPLPVQLPAPAILPLQRYQEASPAQHDTQNNGHTREKKMAVYTATHSVVEGSTRNVKAHHWNEGWLQLPIVGQLGWSDGRNLQGAGEAVKGLLEGRRPVEWRQHEWLLAQPRAPRPA